MFSFNGETTQSKAWSDLIKFPWEKWKYFTHKNWIFSSENSNYFRWIKKKILLHRRNNLKSALKWFFKNPREEEEKSTEKFEYFQQKSVSKEEHSKVSLEVIWMSLNFKGPQQYCFTLLCISSIMSIMNWRTARVKGQAWIYHIHDFKMLVIQHLYKSISDMYAYR